MIKLKPKQLQAANLIASGMLYKDVASDVNVSPETISHWKADPNFEAYLNQLKWDILESARDSIRSATTQALESLIKLSGNAKSEEVRRKACIDILYMAGFQEPDKGFYGWGVGASTPEEVTAEMERERLSKTMHGSLLY